MPMKRLFLSIALITASSVLGAQDVSRPCNDDVTVDDIGYVDVEYADGNDSDEVVCEPQVYFIVEDMPEFPGGETALRKYIAENVNYPENVEPRVTPTVYVRFVIDYDGKVINPEILRGAGELFDKEALRVVSSLPMWKPGCQRGKVVKVSHTVPIKFVSE